MRDHARAARAVLLAGTIATGAYAQTPPPADLPVAQASPASAATQRAEDDGVVIVTGTRTPKAVDKIAGAITVITPADVRRSLTLTEDATAVLARTVPGYSESNQTLNTLAETMRGRTALYLFDGIPQSTPLRDGSRNATFTDMAVVDRIEVIGGASAAEGIGAAGGIINYISKHATKPGLDIGLTARFGTQFHDDSQIYKVGGTVAYKAGAFDAFVAGSYLNRGITYDANGRRIGISASSSLADSQQYNGFGKLGVTFGDGDSQRLEAVASYFKLKSKGGYHYVAGSRALGISDTAEPGPPLSPTGQLLFAPDYNEFQQYTLTYSNTQLLGGSLVATAYDARQAMRFPGDNGVDKQDPTIAPIGTLFDQSEILSKKYGLRTAYSHPDFLLKGLELRFGVDLVHDNTRQYLAQTNRVWVPPLDYNSIGPYVQLSYDIGPLTFSGGMRHEDGKVKVNDYTTTYYRNRVAVQGGKLKYDNNLFNGGAVWRIGSGFSTFASYGEGFTLPNVGIPLRNVNVPGKTVEGLLDLQAVVFKNKEVGANWRGAKGNFGFSYYDSKSKLGSSLAVDPVTKDYILSRRPIHITGYDVTAEYRPIREIKLNLLYSHVKGKTSAANGVSSPLDVTLGTINISPDKLNGYIEYDPMPEAAVVFGSTTILGRHINEGTPNDEITHGYTLFDLTASYRIEKVGTVSIGVENLFNKFYYLASSQIDIFQNYFAGRGRTVSVTVHHDF